MNSPYSDIQGKEESGSEDGNGVDEHGDGCEHEKDH